MEFIEDLKIQIANFQKYIKFFDYFNMEMVEDYYIFLKKNTEKYGFFSNKDKEKIASRHILESILYIYYIKKFSNVSRETSILDIGSGSGIPGFLFACLKENPLVTLLDSSQRRLKKIEEYSKNKGLKNINFIYKRIEEYNEQFDYGTIRALIPFPFNVKIASHIFKKKLFIFSGKIELNESIKKILESCNTKIEKIELIPELEFLGTRNLIIVSHIDNTKKINISSWKEIQKEMKKWQV